MNSVFQWIQQYSNNKTIKGKCFLFKIIHQQHTFTNMSASINQFGLHTIEYAIRKKKLQDPLYIAAHPESLPEPRKSKY